MPVFYRWFIPDHIIYYRVIGDFTVEEIAPLDQMVISMFVSSQRKPVHVLIDISTMRTMPNVRAMMRLRFIVHPNIGYCVVQNRNRLEYFIGNTVGKILGIKYQFVPDLKVGLRFLAKIDDTLPKISVMLARLDEVQQETLEEGRQYL